MPWAIKFESLALKELQRLEKPTRYRIERFLNELTNNPNPRAKGIALQGDKYKGLWRYRVGDYRLICQIKDQEVIILVLEIGHRKEIYR